MHHRYFEPYTGSTLTLVQNITLCPGHQYALSFETYFMGCNGVGLNWQAWAAGQELGSAVGYSPPYGGATVGPLYMNAIPSGPKGSGTPGSADYNSYQYDSESVRIYTQVAITFSCPAYKFLEGGMAEVDNFSMYQTD